MDQIEEFFIRTLDDIASRINSDDPYEILGTSALIRKLFLDDNPLVDQVNRKYRMKIRVRDNRVASYASGSSKAIILYCSRWY